MISVDVVRIGSVRCLVVFEGDDGQVIDATAEVIRTPEGALTATDFRMLDGSPLQLPAEFEVRLVIEGKGD